MLTAILAAFLTITLAPADTIRVGDPTVHAALAGGVDSVDNYIVQDGERRLVVTFVQTITETPEGYLIVQENRGANGTLRSLDSIAVARGTLATTWHGDVTPQGSRHVEFREGRMTGVTVDTLGHETPVDEPVPAGFFDYSIMTLVADRLPLSVGYEATVATYDVTRSAVYTPIEVVGVESIRVNGTEFDTWRMEVHLGEQTVTRWVDRATGKELRWSVTLGSREMIGERRGHR